MSYTVLARRYRSNTFDEVIGQESVARTLLNAIAQGRVAHAYLFTGTRGVGKTTTARLFARALNAPDTIPGCPKPGLISSDEGKKKKSKPKPDGESSSRRGNDTDDSHDYPPIDVQERMAAAIMAGGDLNVVEIDGASNNGVEQARQLIANSGLAPTGNALYKIYIIDEVHMLSTAAFNALLKTMEEPPPHVKFILCTTESHKVPATIQSRCQRFDFRNIPTAKIADHLRDVLRQENVEASDDVLWQLARLGNGSMRDALSLLDRLISTGESPLTPQVLETMLGLPAPELIINLVDGLAAGDVGESLRRTAAILEKGISEDQLVEVLIERLRQLMLISACGPDSELVELADEARKTAATQAGRFDAAGLVHMIALCENLQRAGKSSSNPRALLDATVVRLALSEKMADVAALLAAGGGGGTGSADLKKKVASSQPPAVEAARSVAPASRPVLPPLSSQRTSAPAPAPAAETLQETPAETGDSMREGVATISEAAPGRGMPAVSGASPREVWASVLGHVAGKFSLSWVQSLSLARLDDRTAVVSLLPGKRDMHKFIAADRQREQLADLFKRVLGRPVRIEVEAAGAINGADASDQSPGADVAPSSRSMRTEREEALALPLVQEVLSVFEATLVETHLAAAAPIKTASPGETVADVVKPMTLNAGISDEEMFDDVLTPDDD